MGAPTGYADAGGGHRKFQPALVFFPYREVHNGQLLHPLFSVNQETLAGTFTHQVPARTTPLQSFLVA